MSPDRSSGSTTGSSGATAPPRPGELLVDGAWKRFRGDRRARSLMREGPAGLRRKRGYRWALRDIQIHVAPGEAVGLVGSNGSGKSTLLKLLTQVMDPYAGTVRVGGSVGALIEIQAGLHPELTGRDNVFLYGAFLGIPRVEVARHFDEIVAFAEIDAAIDRQVKFYSSGMKMRLSFAVAATLEPDVLLVDEVLAVGDASFQQRCLDRLRRSIDDGTSLVFVSHDLAAVQSITERTVWLDQGTVHTDGTTADVLGAYRRAVEERARSGEQVGPLRVRFDGARGPDATLPTGGRPVELSLTISTDVARRGALILGVSDGPPSPIVVVRREVDLPAESTTATVTLHDLPLGRGRYAVWVAFHDTTGDELLAWRPLADIDVGGSDLDAPPPGVSRQAPVHVAADWRIGS